MEKAITEVYPGGGMDLILKALEQIGNNRKFCVGTNQLSIVMYALAKEVIALTESVSTQETQIEDLETEIAELTKDIKALQKRTV